MNVKKILWDSKFEKKLTKKLTGKLVKRLFINGKLNTQEWVYLLRFFDTTPRAPTTAKAWLAAATAPDDSRLCTHAVHYLPDIGFVATNGKALHIATCDMPGLEKDESKKYFPKEGYFVYDVDNRYSLPPDTAEHITKRLAKAHKNGLCALPPVKYFTPGYAENLATLPFPDDENYTDDNFDINVLVNAAPEVYYGTEKSGPFSRSSVFGTKFGYAIIMPVMTKGLKYAEF